MIDNEIENMEEYFVKMVNGIKEWDIARAWDDNENYQFDGEVDDWGQYSYQKICNHWSKK